MSMLTTCSLTFIDLNEIHIGDAPANPMDNELWFDTTNNILKKYNAKSKIWEIVNDYTQDIIDALEGLQVSSRNLLASTSYESQIICTNTTNQTGGKYDFVRTIDYIKNIKDKEITLAFDWELVTSGTPSGTFMVQTVYGQYVQIGNTVTISNSNYYGTCVFTTTLKTESNTVGIRFRCDSVTGTFKITHPRLFYGSKDLGWTQAPEDLTAQFETIINKQADGIYMSVTDKDKDVKSLVTFDSKKVVIDSANIDLKGYVTISSLSNPSSTTTIDGNLITTDTLSANKIKTGKIQGKNSNTYFNLDDGTLMIGQNTTGNYLSWDGSNLKVRASSLNIGSESVATTGNVNDAVNNIQIGGRNLIKNSNFFNGTKNWVAENLTASIVDDPYYIKALKVTTPSNNRIYQNSSNIWKTGQSYVVSFYAKASTNGGTIGPSRSISDFGTTQTLTTEWQRYSCVFKSSITTESGTLSLSFSNADEIYITQIQLEYGNKVSDWTPAQEDIDASINSVSGALSSLDSSVKSAFGDGIINDSEANALASNIQILNNEKSDIDKEYATIYANSNLASTAKTNLASAKTAYDSAHSSLISSINTVTADKIITVDERNSVESFFTTYRTKIADYKQRLQEALDYISTKKVEDIEIGGRNLVLNSSTLNNQFSQLNTFKGTRTILDDNTAKSGKVIKIECTTAGTGFFCDLWSGNDSCIGKKYTWSFYSKMNTNKTLKDVGHERNGRIPISVTTEWSKFTHTWTYSSSGNRAFIFYPNFVVGDILYIKDFKIEEGNKCSDWVPAPEDVDLAITTVDNKVISTTNRVSTIETDLSGITLRVGSTESTITSHTTDLGKVDTKISDAKTAAINSAASDATSKANSAKTAAISSAASDATSKADAAKASATAAAKTYTDGQVKTVNETIVKKESDIKLTTDSITSRVASTESNITTHTTELGKVDGKINTAVNLGTLYVKGTGNNRSANRIVQLNGTDILNTGNRGFNVVVINRSNLSVRSNTYYDVYGSDDPKTSMANALNTLKDDCIVVITSFDAIATNDALDAALIRCGGTGTRFGGSFHRVPYALVGIPNIGKGSGIEIFTTVEVDAPYAEINTKIVNGTPEGISTNSRELYSSISTTNSKVSTIESNLSGITSRVSTTESNISTANGNITSLTERVKTAEQKITDDSIVTTVTKSQTNGKNTFIQQSDITQLDQSWTATFKDGYNQGITTINKDGITVSSSNVKSKTSMDSSGFKITKTDTSEDVFKVNADGTLTIKGNITVTGGSIPVANLDGKLSSTQLDSTITSDISTAKSSASTALSTANSANTTAGTAKNTADSAKSTATTASTNASSALTAANSAKSTADLLAQGLNKWMLTAYDIAGAGYTTSTVPTFNMLSNRNIKFIKEILDSGTSITINLGDNYIGHAKTNIYLDADYSFTTSLTTDDAGAIYLNGSLVTNTVSCTAKSITLSLKAGWNTVEVLFTEISGGDGFVLSPKFSATTQIKRINAYEVSSVSIASGLVSEVKSTIDDNKTNWINAYNRVNEWASGAVTGKTTINGGLIETNTILANHIAIGDFNNYSQLTKGKGLENRYGTAVWVEGTSNDSYWQSSSKYFPFTVNETLNSFKPGDKIQVKFDVCTEISRSVSVGIWFYSDYSSSANTTSTTSEISCTSSWSTKTIALKLPDSILIQNAKSIAILINNGTSAELIKVRNVTILRQVAGDLIVDGSITTDHINTSGLNADVIKAGTISADRIDANTIVSKVNGATTTVSGNKIRTGQITANSGGSYLNLDNGSMMLGTTSLTSYLQWTGSALNIKASSLSISGISAATTTNVSDAKTQAINEASGVKDTRTTNQSPDWYISNYPQRTIQEFKSLAILGLTGDGTYGTLETKIPWKDSGGGYPTQTFFGSNADVFTRRGTSGTAWSAWVRKANATQSDVFNALTNNGTAQGIYIQDGKVYLNASMIKTGSLDASLITTENLTGKTITGGTISGGTISGTSISGGTITGGTISGGSININNSFKVDSSGKMIATGAEINGKVTLSAGSTVPTSTLNGTVSSSQLHSDITTSISNANTSANNANNKIDNLQIGGRNLLPDTDGVFSSANYHGNCTITRGQTDPFGGTSAILIIGTSTADSFFRYIENKILFNQVGEYVISIWLKANKNGNIDLNLNARSAFKTCSLNTSWQKFEFVANVENIAKVNHFVLGGWSVWRDTSFQVYMAFPMLEKGNKSSSWTPSPEDVNTAITNVDNKVIATANRVSTIETDLSGITLRVGSTESTITSHTTDLGKVDTKISDAKTAAINSAATDATSKANSAKTSAVSTAASDATSKANSALASAKSYTDGQVKTVNETITKTEAAIKLTTDSITSRVASTESSITTTNGNVTALTTRMSTAENKITDSSITTLIKKDFYTKTQTDTAITTKGYQTSSQVKQTVDSLELKFTQTGGYNLLYNGDFSSGFDKWFAYGSSGLYSSPSGLSCPNGKGAGIIGDHGVSKWYSQTINVRTNQQPITFSYYTHVSEAGWHGATNPFRRGQMTLYFDDGTVQYCTPADASSYEKWEKITYTVYPTKNVSRIDVYLFNRDTTRTVHYSGVMVEVGTIAHDWSPNPNEVKDGITTIDKDGITISMIDGEGSKGSSRVSHDGIATYDQWGNTKSYFSDDKAYIKELNTESINNPYLVQFKPRPTDWFIGQYQTGDGTGRDKSNKSNSIQSVFAYIKNNYGIYINNQDITIYCDDGININENIFIRGWLGCGAISIVFGTSSTFTGYIRVEDCVPIVALVGGGTWDWTSGCRWYRTAGGEQDSALSVRNSTVYCYDFRTHSNANYSHPFLFASYGSTVILHNIDFVKYWAICHCYMGADVYIDLCRGDVSILCQKTESSNIVARSNLPIFDSGKDIYNYWNSTATYDGVAGSNSLWYPKATPEAPAPSVPAAPSQSWHWAEKTFYFNLSSTAEGSGNATTNWSGKWGQGSWGSYKSHRGHAVPTESINNWASGARNISMILTMTRLSSNHGNYGATPIPKLKQKDGSYWNSGVAYALGNTKSITLSSGIVSGLSDGTLGELTMWAGSTNSDYSMYDNVSLTVTCEKYY